VTSCEQRRPDRPGDPGRPADPGRGRRLGIDVGTVRIGVAISDPDAILATPVETVARERRSGDKHLRRLVRLVTDNDIVEVVVGLPRTLADKAGTSAADAVDIADALAHRIGDIPVRLADERLTTVTAQRSLREAGVRSRGQRAVIDQAAAVAILQGWLDQRRALLPQYRPADEEETADG